MEDPIPVSKTNILRSIFPEVTISELEEILLLCRGNLKESCDEITHRLKLQSQGSSAMHQGSVVQLYREYETDCQYCKIPWSKSVSYGMNSEQMTVDDFQFLLDRGWARCGKWVYLPINHKSCCPTYTIRLNVKEYQRNRSHRKAINRFNRYLDTGSCSGPHNIRKRVLRKNTSILEEQDANECRRIIERALLASFPSLEPHNDIISLIELSPCKIKSMKRKIASNICFKIAKRVQQPPASIATLLAPLLPPSWESIASKNGFINFNYAEVSMVPPGSPMDTETSSKASSALSTGHTLKVTLEEPSFTQEKYKLYKKYQIAVHNSKESSSELLTEGFTDFLCNTPLIKRPAASAQDPECGYGSFHQIYRIDGKLVAIGVIDILPNCLSSSYFIYHPDYSFLSLGVVSAVREIDWVKENILRNPDSALRFYYLGYYVHTCSKVRYKVNFSPSDLLCPVTLSWVPYERVKQILDQNIYRAFSDSTEQPPNYSPFQLCQLVRSYPLLVAGSACLLVNLTEDSRKRIQRVLQDFLKYAGDEVAVRFSYYFS